MSTFTAIVFGVTIGLLIAYSIVYRIDDSRMKKMLEHIRELDSEIYAIRGEINYIHSIIHKEIQENINKIK
jgi:uncharacterized membrane protein (DUF106 family)